MKRCFLGFELAPAGLAYLKEKILPLEELLSGETGWDIRLVRPENWHATLLFFPGLDGPEREAVWARVVRAAGEGAWRDLAFDWRGVALWPTPRRPSLLCLEAESYPEAARWPLPLTEAPFTKGKLENLHTFRPHVTVMRFRRGRQRNLGREWRDLKERLPSISPEKIKLERVSLFLSTLSSNQPIYPREYSVSLG